jgi:hypothetical protein
MKPKTWSPVDPRHFEGKSLSELQKRLFQAKEFCVQHPEFQFGWYNEYVEELRRIIAERIGK